MGTACRRVLIAARLAGAVRSSNGAAQVVVARPRGAFESQLAHLRVRLRECLHHFTAFWTQMAVGELYLIPIYVTETHSQAHPVAANCVTLVANIRRFFTTSD